MIKGKQKAGVKAQVSRQAAFARILDLPCMRFVTLGSLFNLSVPQLPLLCSGDDDSAYLVGLLRS